MIHTHHGNTVININKHSDSSLYYVRSYTPLVNVHAVITALLMKYELSSAKQFKMCKK